MLDDQGQMVSVTLLKLENQKVTKVVSKEKHGYNAIQVGYWAKAEKKLAKPDISRLRKAKIEENFTSFKEFRLDQQPDETLAVGTSLVLDVFDGVENIDVTGHTKGRGFQGAVKRHNVSRGRMTHGSHFHRGPGSLGSGTTPGRVMKNKRMPGHMGTNKVTVQNLKLMSVDKELQIVAIKGSVPGYKNGILFAQPSSGSVPAAAAEK